MRWRPAKFIRSPEYFILLQPVFILNTINWIRIIRNAQKLQHILRYRIANTDGKNFLANDCIYLTREITEWKSGWPAFIIFSDHRVPGWEERKKHPLRCAEKSLKQKTGVL